MNASSTISRRGFARLLGAAAAASVMRPAISLAREPVAAEKTINDVVRLSSNENPYGPAASAFQAMTEAFDLAGRYPDEQSDRLIEGLARVNGVRPEQILLGDGSTEILKICAETFTDAGRNLVTAEPTFEALLNNAKARGAEVVKVPLTDTFAHDLPKMAAAAKGGLVYLCNPNNPTASITPKEAVREFIAKMPGDVTILVDEAYFHFADAPDYESVIPLVPEHPNLVVARTFSKIYGMAGLRCGYAVGQKETIARMRANQMWDSLNCLALAAASASLEDKAQVTNGRRLNTEVKAFTVSELEGMGYQSIPSQANFIMFDVKRPVAPLIQVLKERKVEVGRLFPALPNYMRVTIGKRNEMEAFLRAFRAVMAA